MSGEREWVEANIKFGAGATRSPSRLCVWLQCSMESILLSISVVVILLAGPSFAPPSLADELVKVAPHRADIIPKVETPPLFGYLV